MRTFGLIGFPLAHSFSEKYFQEKFQREHIADAVYKSFPLQNISDFPLLVKENSTLCGINVTIPYKESVLAFLDELEEKAGAVGAVNCIKIVHSSLRDRGEAIYSNDKVASVGKRPHNDGLKLIGYNTDIYGFSESLKPILKSHHERALILGTGGAAKAVEYVLRKIGIECLFASRINSPVPRGIKNCITYEKLNSYVIASHHLIINTTPLGMYPEIEDCPTIPYECLGERHLLYDLIYNPEETLFLKKGKEKGAAVQNGLTMLKLQAEKSWQIWNSNL